MIMINESFFVFPRDDIVIIAISVWNVSGKLDC